MGLFEKIFKRAPTRENEHLWKTLTAYAPCFTSWHGNLYESELVRAAIDSRSRHIAKLKCEMLGTARPKLKTKMLKAPNAWQTWYQFLYRTNTILDMQNTAFIVPIFDEYEEVTGYYSVLPSACTIVSYNDVPWLKYTFTNGETAAVELSQCGILTKYQYDSDFFGASNAALTETMNLISLQNQGVEEAIKNSNTFRFMAQISNFTKAEDLAKERKRFNRQNFKDDDGGGLLLFPNTYQNIQQLKQTAYTVNEAERNEIRTNVYNYFGVNEDVLQNKAYGDAWQAFYEGAIEPFAIQFSEVMTKIIYTLTEQGNGNRLMLTANRLQYMSTEEKLKVSSQMADRGILNRDEVREIWNLPPLPDGEGQAYIIRGEYKNALDAAEGGEADET